MQFDRAGAANANDTGRPCLKAPPGVRHRVGAQQLPSARTATQNSLALAGGAILFARLRAEKVSPAAAQLGG
jgi:hypothetical protein